MVRRMTRRVVAVLAVALAAAIAAGPASAGPTWLPPVTLEGGSAHALWSQVAIDARGNAIAVWIANGATHRVVHASLRPAGSGLWQSPVDLSLGDRDAYSPRIAFDRQGNAIAVWDEQSPDIQPNTGPPFIAEAAFRPAVSGVWQAPAELPTAPVTDTPAIAFDSQGNVMALAVTQLGLQATFRPAAAGDWEQPVVVGSGDDPQIAFDAQGNAFAVWVQSYFVRAAVRPAETGLWQPPAFISAAGTPSVAAGPRDVQVAVDAGGDAMAIWTLGNPGFAVQTALRPAESGAWQPPVDLPDPGPGPADAQISFDSQGNAIAVWGVRWAVYAAFRPAASGEWQEPAGFPAGLQVAPQVAFDARGNAIMVWAGSGVEAAVRAAATGTWEQPASLSLPDQGGSTPHVAFDAQGNALAIWDYVSEFAAEYDATGPALGALSIPKTGHARRPIAFSVAPLDVFSALGSTIWSFGDGTTSTGRSRAHAYKQRGTYEVMLTSRDALGNASVATQTIAIKAAIPPPKITAARLTRTNFAAMTFHVRLSAAARLEIAITSKSPGRTLTVIRRPHSLRGRTAVAFSGRIKGRILAPGRYAARITATTIDGRATRTVGFTIRTHAS